jgi:hypothetical protein
MAKRGAGMTTTREPARDVRAQVAAVASPASAKQAAFIAKGTPVPATPGMLKVKRPEGTLVTKSPAHAAAFAAQKRLIPAAMAPLLGYPESKGAAIAASGGKPLVVQGRTPKGAVAHESVASPGGLLDAALAAKAAVPAGKVKVMTPEQVLARRKGMR